MTSMIDPRLRDRIRIAKVILRRLPPRLPPSIDLPAGEWQAFQNACTHLATAQARGWRTARIVAAENLHRRTEQLVIRLRAVAQAAQRTAIASPRATLADVIRDLAVLGDEFPAFHWDLKAHTLSVTTEEIHLEDVGLGPFEIRLDLRRLGYPRPYDVIALEPNPAAGDSSTTHPHIRNDDLCEGEGRTAIQSALRQGRLLDFFVLVRQILETYNADSAYVPLTRWEGTRCPDCGTTVSDDELSCCEACDSDVCGDCSTSCQGSRCGRSLCGTCGERCGDCGETYCARCLTSCPGCGDDYCADCLTGGRCSDCPEIPENDDDETTTPEPAEAESAETRSPDTETTGAALHAMGLGQAAVS